MCVKTGGPTHTKEKREISLYFLRMFLFYFLFKIYITFFLPPNSHKFIILTSNFLNSIFSSPILVLLQKVDPPLILTKLRYMWQVTRLSRQHVFCKRTITHMLCHVTKHVSIPQFDWISIYRQNSCLIVLIYIKTNLNFRVNIFLPPTKYANLILSL
jgi:hypothetical protein